MIEKPLTDDARVLSFTDEWKEFLSEQRVARIATVNPDGTIHIVPICFVFDSKSILSTLIKGEKRLANMTKGSRVSIVIDQYQEKARRWTVLRGVLMYGEVRVLDYVHHKRQFMRGWRLLIEKYPQYRYWAHGDLTPKDPDRRRIMTFKPDKIVAWGFS